MQLISLTSSVHVWAPKASLPVAAVALLGTVEEQGDVSRAEVYGLVPPCGGLLTFESPVAVTLATGAVAATQEVPAGQPASQVWACDQTRDGGASNNG